MDSPDGVGTRHDRAVVDGQIKTLEDGSRAISYGLSSYGYDLRVSREFKVFTNIFNTVVDPKDFDSKSFVDIETDVCIVPPNPLPWPAAWSIFAFRARR